MFFNTIPIIDLKTGNIESVLKLLNSLAFQQLVELLSLNEQILDLCKSSQADKFWQTKLEAISYGPNIKPRGYLPLTSFEMVMGLYFYNQWAKTKDDRYLYKSVSYGYYHALSELLTRCIKELNQKPKIVLEDLQNFYMLCERFKLHWTPGYKLLYEGYLFLGNKTRDTRYYQLAFIYAKVAEKIADLPESQAASYDACFGNPSSFETAAYKLKQDMQFICSKLSPHLIESAYREISNIYQTLAENCTVRSVGSPAPSASAFA